MADPELEAIRQRRMQELMAQRGIGNQHNSEQQKAQEEAKREADERRQMMLSQILSSEARERHKLKSAYNMITVLVNLSILFYVARIALVKPEKARGVEDVLLRAAQMGQIVEKVSKERLISLLEQINNQTTKQTKVTIQRRRSVLEEDD
ncbi:PREDICTED: DNA-binding protein DDB_G0278111-like isoform X1 [Nelumbo nucifera]|uniref:DNA-binding protein DDB_G0278111-like isoform X1 n=1 Tax=Nelumbo nucifera TaxID=4432 RepID=A0A1U8B4G3_NELNU|nr:PREDICTED: DNA-binding protein DDB_G0278111-like isoform X1 [Nelumbo nucifera]